jgi:hypothetical protein
MVRSYSLGVRHRPKVVGPLSQIPCEEGPSVERTNFTWPHRLLSLEVKALKIIFFTGALTVSTFSAHPHSGSQALRGEFLFLRLAMYFDSSYATPSFQQRNRIRCHLKANARSAA